MYAEVQKLVEEEDTPKILIIHCGANSIGLMSIRKLRNYMKYTISQIVELLPHTLIVWSKMLSSLTWRNMISNNSAESQRVRINSCISTFVTRKKRGACNRYNDIKQEQTKLFVDSVHLSKLGNSLFLNTLQGAIYTFITSTSCIYQ